jgi:hypothetical protein
MRQFVVVALILLALSTSCRSSDLHGRDPADVALSYFSAHRFEPLSRSSILSLFGQTNVRSIPAELDGQIVENLWVARDDKQDVLFVKTWDPAGPFTSVRLSEQVTTRNDAALVLQHWFQILDPAQVVSWPDMQANQVIKRDVVRNDHRIFVTATIVDHGGGFDAKLELRLRRPDPTSSHRN